MNQRSLGGALVILVLGFSNLTIGQVERSELGKRLRRFELAWQTAPVELQQKSATPMQAAVTSFFSLQLAGAAKQLDGAWRVVRNEPPGTAESAVTAFRIHTENQIVEPESAAIKAQLQSFYQTKAVVPANCQVKFEIRKASGEILSVTELPWSEALDPVELPIENLPAGDYLLAARINVDGKIVDLLPTGFSRINDLTRRLAELEKIARDPDSKLTDVVRATLRDQVDLLRSMNEGDVKETDYPAAQILTLGESLVADVANGSNLIAVAAKQHDVWLTLANERKRVPVRVRMPDSHAEKMPVLFLMHGAGGSENMFFETYGAGGAVTSGLKRGWLVVAPRQSLGGLRLDCSEMLDSLESIFPIDRSRVLLLGHSMGAGQVIRQAVLHPELPCGVAAIGGGGAIKDAARIADIPWFIAAGELDFGRRGAVALHRSLKTAGASRNIYQEYPGVEHLVIVQAALEDTFKFFDSILDR